MTIGTEQNSNNDKSSIFIPNERLQKVVQKPIRNIAEVEKFPKFHPECKNTMDFQSLSGMVIILLDGNIIEDYPSQFGERRTAQILACFENPDRSNDIAFPDKYFTTISSNTGIVNQINKLTKKHDYPVRVMLVQQESNTPGQFYYIFK